MEAETPLFGPKMKKFKKLKLNRKTMALAVLVVFLATCALQRNSGFLSWLQILEFVMIVMFDADPVSTSA